MHLTMQHLFDLILVLLVLPILRSGGQSSHVHQLANIYGGEGGLDFHSFGIAILGMICRECFVLQS